MLKRSLAAVGILVLASARLAAQPEGLPPPRSAMVRDIWDAAFLDGHRAGYVRLKVEELPTPSGQKIVRATQEMFIKVRRGGDIAVVKVLTGTDETPDGKVVGVFMIQGLGANVVQELHGKVENGNLVVKAVGQKANFQKVIPWDPRVVSAIGEQELLRKRNPRPQPGDTFDYVTYNPIINAVVVVHVKIENYEDTMLQSPAGPQKQRLLRVSMIPNEIENVLMPGQVVWYDEKFEIRKSLANLTGFGFLSTERSTQAIAMQQIAPQFLPDIMDRQAIKLARAIPQAHLADSIRYRITLNDREPGATFARDNRQTVQNAQSNSFELLVKALRKPPENIPAGALQPGPEFTSSNFFITSSDAKVQQHASAAVGNESDPWRKALLIEGYVRRNMRVQNFTEAMAPASEVARTLTGDCTEYSMLAAAMCRAKDVPARTAIGLVYVDVPPPRQPFFGFHMWTEVCVNNTWVALDATLGQGSIGPAHLKIGDQSWHETFSMSPLLPLMRVIMAQPRIEVIGMNGK